uniref:Uncharacterized protein n=1 Tax=Romanomermis culicivorax TaxID=13658 RepID=A0A915IRV7_ROMCU
MIYLADTNKPIEYQVPIGWSLGEITHELKDYGDTFFAGVATAQGFPSTVVVFINWTGPEDDVENSKVFLNIICMRPSTLNLIERCEAPPKHLLVGDDEDPWQEPPNLPLPPKEALGPYKNMNEFIERFNELELTWFFKEDQPLLEYKPYNQGETKGVWLGTASKLAAKSEQEKEVIDFDLDQFHQNYSREQESASCSLNIERKLCICNVECPTHEGGRDQLIKAMKPAKFGQER